MKIKHTKFCKNQQIAYEQQEKQYAEKWPDYCKKCNGWGGFWSQYDPSPAGVSLGSGYMLDFEPCECIEDGRCPRCDRKEIEITQEDEFVCVNCGWVSDQEDENSWGLPQPPECYCWEEAEAKQVWSGLMGE